MVHSWMLLCSFMLHYGIHYVQIYVDLLPIFFIYVEVIVVILVINIVLKVEGMSVCYNICAVCKFVAQFNMKQHSHYYSN